MNEDSPTWLSIETDRLIESEADDKADWNSPESRRKAIKRIENEISSTGGGVLDHRKLINACLATGRLEHARQSINRAIDLYPGVGVFHLYRAILERNEQNPEATADAYEGAIDLLSEDDAITFAARSDYVQFLFRGIDIEDRLDTDIKGVQVGMFPDERFSRALDHLPQIYTRLRAELTHSESPRANDISSFVWAAIRYVEAEAQVSGIQQAHDRVEDAFSVLDRSNPQRGAIVWTLVNQVVDQQNEVWGRQMTGLMLIVNWEYEAASEVFRPLWEQRTDYNPEDHFWDNLLISMAHYAGCLAVGDIDSTPETVAQWTRDAGLSGNASELIPEYLLDETNKMERKDPPSAFHYTADSRAEEIGRIPTPVELDEYAPDELCLHATGILLSELLSQDATLPFDPKTVQKIKARPDCTDNPQLYDVDGIGRKLALNLSEVGIQTVADLQCLSRNEMLDINRIGPSTADTILADLDY